MAFDYITSGTPTIPAPTQPALAFDKDNNLVYVSTKPSLSNAPAWVMVGGIGTNPAGATTQLQYNDGGSFGADANLVWNKTAQQLTLTGNAVFQRTFNPPAVDAQFDNLSVILSVNSASNYTSNLSNLRSSVMVSGAGNYGQVNGLFVDVVCSATGTTGTIQHALLLDGPAGGTVSLAQCAYTNYATSGANTTESRNVAGTIAATSGGVTSLNSNLYGSTFINNATEITDNAGVRIVGPVFGGGASDAVIVANYGVYIGPQVSGAQTFGPITQVAEDGANVVTITAAGTYFVGQKLVLNGLTTRTDLNFNSYGEPVVVTGTDGSTFFRFDDIGTFGAYGPAADTGSVTGRNLQPWGIFEASALEKNALGSINIGGQFGPLVSAGVGDPEGVLAAPIGSVYLRQDGTPGATLYVKQATAGNTGWDSVSPISLQTNGTPNSTPTLLNLVEGTGIHLVEAAGSVTVSTQGVIGVASGSVAGTTTGNFGPTVLQTGGTPANQQILQFYIGVVTAGAGGTTITVTISWNDGAAKTRTIVNALAADSTNSSASVSIPLFLANGQNLSITITSAGAASYAYMAQVQNSV